MSSADRLRPYVAGIAVDWLSSMPDVRHRSIGGSLAFVDISGFTTLTERLAAKGKVGAEEMSDLLNDSFATLLKVAYGYGASLVKWGGDAVLLLYEDDDHAAQACRAAFEMQRTMRHIGRLRTSVGVVQLKMSVGISSGRFDFFLVGERHRELLVAGPAATETAIMEQVAEAGEVVVSAATAALLPSGCLGSAKEPGWLLGTAPPADPRSRWWPPAQPDHVAACLDPTLREHLLTEVGDSEHRQVAVGFVEVSGVDGLLEQQGPGATAGALHELMQVVQDACAHHRVTFWETDISKDGFKVLLIAGAPKTSGHDEDGMLRAARAILDSYSAPDRLRIGVNTGRVFNGGFGPPFRRTWSVKGDAVNLAARVMAKAEQGQLLATETLLRRIPSRVDADLVPPFMVKGKRLQVHAAVVHRISSDHAVDTGRAGAFVGRRKEMDTLLEAVRLAARGHGGGIVVTGDPGVGKSRLVDHALNRIDEATTVLRGFGDDYESATSYFAVRRLVRAAIGQSVDASDAVVAAALRQKVASRCPELESMLPLLAVPFGVDLPDTQESAAVQEQFRRPRTMSLVVDFLSMVLNKPTVMLVDDVQVADDSSVELLGRLARCAADRPWVVVLVDREVRGSISGIEGVRTLAVQPLSAEDARALVLDTPGAELLAPHVLRGVVERGEGNPLFLHELTLAVVAADSDELPSSLEDLLAAQIDDLAPSARRLLRSVSVLGSRFDEALAVEVLGQPPTPEQWSMLDHFLARHADGSRRFRTRLARDAAYEGLPYRRRVELHDHAATALQNRVNEDDDQAEALSFHCLAAQRYGDAGVYSAVAAERARRVYANAEALVFLHRAREALRHLPATPPTEIAKAEEAIGDANVRLADLTSAMEAYRQARKHAPREDPLLRGRIGMSIGFTAEDAGAVSQAARWFTLARKDLGLTRGADRQAALALEGRSWVALAYMKHAAGRHAEVSEYCQRAIEIAEPAGALDVVGSALHVLDLSDVYAGRQGDEDRVRRALALFEQSGNLPRQAEAWNHLGIRAYFAADWNLARERYQQARAIYLRCGDEWGATYASANIAEILVDQGRLAEAEPLAREALRVLRTSATPTQVGFVAALLGRICARSSRHIEALALYDEALVAYAAKDERSELAETQMRIAESYLMQGQAKAALHWLERTEAVAPDASHEPAFRRLSGVALVQLGDLASGLDGLRAAVEEARLRDSAHEFALSAATLMDAGDDSHGQEGRRILEDLGIVWTPQMPRTAAATQSAADVSTTLPRQRGGQRLRAER